MIPISSLGIDFFSDCARICPDGGNLSPNCEICECVSSTIIGTVNDRTNFSVAEVDIFLSYRPWSPIATTNVRGRYTVSNICFNSTSVFVKKGGFSTQNVTPRRLNNTHWEANFEIRKLGLFKEESLFLPIINLTF